jgi:hypothetical protein
MAAGEQPDRHPFEQHVLPDDGAFDLEQDLLERTWGTGRHLWSSGISNLDGAVIAEWS